MLARFNFCSPLLELVLPEYCLGCGALKGNATWYPKGKILSGLRPWDGPHLCASCFEVLSAKKSVSRPLQIEGMNSIPVVASQWTNPLLVDLVGQWKYFGVRGLAWPLGDLLVSAILQNDMADENTIWVPLPLHRKRERERGFNQAGLLAAHLAEFCGGSIMADLFIRSRATRQQAKLDSAQDRQNNMLGVFECRRTLDRVKLEKSRVIAVDDIVTTGATAGSLVNFGESVGLKIEAVVCLGLARPTSSDC